MTEENQSIGQFEIKPDLYIARFPRLRHPYRQMIENGQTYFDDSQRLTDYEFGQFETHHEYYSRLLERRENNQETHNYIACMSGNKIPKTLDEQIIVKLIYQALAIGGLHATIGPYTDDNAGLKKISNDITSLSSQHFKYFLIKLASKMNSLVRENYVYEKPQQWDSTIEQQAHEELYLEGQEYYMEVQEYYMEVQEYYMEVQDEINELISDYALRHAQSEETGWFYFDDD